MSSTIRTSVASNQLVSAGSITDLSAKLGCSPSTIEKLRSGVLKPSREFKARIAEVLGIDAKLWDQPQARVFGQSGGKQPLPEGVIISRLADGRGWGVQITTPDGVVEYRSIGCDRERAERLAAKVAAIGPTPHTFVPVFGQDLTAGRRKFAPQGFGLDQRAYT